MLENYLLLIPRSQPWTKKPARERISFGRRGMSNDCRMSGKPWKRLRRVWWCDSIVMMEAVAVRTRESLMRCAAPSYTPKPTFSTSQATVTIVSILTGTLEKSNKQIDNGNLPKLTKGRNMMIRGGAAPSGSNGHT